MLVDTSFLIHQERELRRGGGGAAHAFIEAHPSAHYFISIITVGEFAEGFEASEEPACHRALSRYTLLDLDRDIAWRAGQVSRRLRATGLGIGDNDIWIAATALHHKLPLVTNNVKYFSRIAGLALMTY